MKSRSKSAGCVTRARVLHPTDIAVLERRIGDHILLAMLEFGASLDMCVHNRGINRHAKLAPETLKYGLSVLRRRGLIEHHIGLWSVDGDGVAGAGHAITHKGFARLDMKPVATL